MRDECAVNSLRSQARAEEGSCGNLCSWCGNAGVMSPTGCVAPVPFPGYLHATKQHGSPGHCIPGGFPDLVLCCWGLQVFFYICFLNNTFICVLLFLGAGSVFNAATNM